MDKINMRDKNAAYWLVLLGGLLFSVVHNSVRAMQVDDARTLEKGQCQLESWLRFNHGGTQRTLSPACSPVGGLELNASAMFERDTQGMFLSEGQLQGKYLLTPVRDDGYIVSLVMGAVRQKEGEEREPSWGYFTKVPVSFVFGDGDVLLHTNWGVRRHQGDKTTRLTWGIGNETRLNARFTLLGEVFGEDKGKPLFQAGLRTTLIPEKVELDLTYGNRSDFPTDERFVLLGLRLISPAWF
jgi:hypothetical protein